MKKKYLLILPLISLMFFTSCNGDDDVTPEDVDNTPTTYNFDDVDYSGQTTRMDMLAELKSYISTSHDDTTTVLDETVIINMYTGSGFSDSELDASGKNLSGKTDTTLLDARSYLISAATSSNSTIASDGSPGRVVRGDSYILVDEKGFEFAQIIEKGLMSATFMDQALNNYLNDIELDDNTDFTEGKGTSMAHHWDEAYGYFTRSTEFPAAGTDDFWGKYSNTVDGSIESNDAIGYAFRKGRQAIINGDITTVTEQSEIIKTLWTKIAAATAIHYFNDSKGYLATGETGNLFHALSEAYGFTIGVKAGGGDVNDIISGLEEGLYDITEDDLNNYINSLAAAHDLEAVKSDL